MRRGCGLCASVGWRSILACACTFSLAAIGQEAVAAVTAKPPAQQQQRNATLGRVKSIVDGMEGAGTRIKQGDTGTGTRTIQEKVVDDLQKLIDEAKSKSKQSKQRSSNNRNESGSQNRPESQQTPGSDAGSGAKPSSGQPGRKPGAGKPSVSERKPPGLPQRPLLREVWGHLPPALRERVPSDFHEAILPAYDDLVRRYFESLLDSSSERGSDQSATTPGRGISPSAPAPDSPAQ